MCPVQSRTREKLDGHSLSRLDARLDPITVKLEFVDPVFTIRR